MALTAALLIAAFVGVAELEQGPQPRIGAVAATRTAPISAEAKTIHVELSRGRDRPRGPRLAPIADRLRHAARITARRGGPVSFAIVGRDGRPHGQGIHRAFPSASVVKAMLLAAELRRLDDEGLELDSSTDALLHSMITYSDNAAATAIFLRVGEDGLRSVASRAGMSDFTVAVSWGYATISAADMALLFADLDRVLPRQYQDYAKRLLGSIVPEQSWGIPAARPEWKARFKGGWRPTALGQLVSQAAELRRGDRKLGLAILTDGQPTMEHGIETIQRVARALVAKPSRPKPRPT